MKLPWNPFITLITVIKVITPKQIPRVERKLVAKVRPFLSTFEKRLETKKIHFKDALKAGKKDFRSLCLFVLRIISAPGKFSVQIIIIFETSSVLPERLDCESVFKIHCGNPVVFSAVDCL